MGLWILHDPDNERAVLYDSVSEWAFGPGFLAPEAAEKAQAFIDWLPIDARTLPAKELEAAHKTWYKMAVDSEGRLRPVGEQINRT